MTPFQRTYIPQREIDRVRAETLADFRRDPTAFRQRWGLPDEANEADVLAQIDGAGIEDDAVFSNDTYQVYVRQVRGEGLPALVHLSVKRLDKQPIHDWRDLQRIKSELVGPECEGCELYPRESRVVDTANQYHLWVFADPGVMFPFGFDRGVRVNESLRGAVQRPL